jgi:hypothetical protein
MEAAFSEFFQVMPEKGMAQLHDHGDTFEFSQDAIGPLVSKHNARSSRNMGLHQLITGSIYCSKTFVVRIVNKSVESTKSSFMIVVRAVVIDMIMP